MPASTQPAVGDIARQSPIDNILLLGVTGSVTVTGYFVDIRGNKTGNSFSGTVLQANGSNNPSAFSDIYGSALPTDAIGARVVLSGNVYWVGTEEATASADIKTNYARYPQAIADPEYNLFGRAA